MVKPNREEVPEQLGPYTVIRVLGKGGMGTVYLAHDARLGRQVAIKSIQAQYEGSLKKRLWREARLVASLNHPNIVQVYDILQEGGQDYLVMEFVKGVDLRQFLNQQTASNQKKMDILCDVVRGLHEAHLNGVVHRDLKTENVLVSDKGYAKIADFGIASFLRKHQAQETLTTHNTVLGTYRCMSPEQARGEPANPASDLFSLGVLFYEVLLGISPFRGENELATLNRIMTHHPRPLHEQSAQIPLEISRLVEHLLQKDPRLRPRNAQEVLAVIEKHGRVSGQTDGDEPPTVFPDQPNRAGSPKLRSRLAIFAALILFLIALAWYFWPSPDPVHVVVMKPVVKGQPEQAEILAEETRYVTARTLLALKGVTTSPLADVDDVEGSDTEVARALAADNLLTLELDYSGPTWTVTLSRVGVASKTLLWTDRMEVPQLAGPQRARAVAALVLRAFPKRRHRDRPMFDVSQADYTAFRELQKQFFNNKRLADPKQIRQELAEIHAGSPNFLDAYLLESSIARWVYTETLEPGHLTWAKQAASQARLLAPEDPEPVYEQIFVALAEGDLERVSQLLEVVSALAPGSSKVLALKAQYLEKRNQPELALKEMRTATARHPSWRSLFNLAQMELRLGDPQAARKTVAQILAINPTNHPSRILEAKVELISGNPARAAALYAAIVEKSPGITELNGLGLAQFLLRDYHGAIETFGAMRKLAKDHSFVLLNLADANLLAGNRIEAEGLYRRVTDIIGGYQGELGWQFLTVKAQAHAHLGETKDALAAVLAALRLAPDDSQAMMETAVVYALLDERASAAHYVREAMLHGVEPVWFTAPWFDRLRQDPRFVGSFD